MGKLQSREPEGTTKAPSTLPGQPRPWDVASESVISDCVSSSYKESAGICHHSGRLHKAMSHHHSVTVGQEQETWSLRVHGHDMTNTRACSSWTKEEIDSGTGILKCH